ncbi:ubiquitin-protein ligase [Saccharomycopsis crataegensis]|uniref:RING-type E3 ubiquitin transferase n=1 Tax=Saccharomycopsis crataegensis TaxID=43959 RepID=A0AAV5QV72_9ASCO|nr:ubiquitin-protein ligase [Saccharomycopsis crataegensis]
MPGTDYELAEDERQSLDTFNSERNRSRSVLFNSTYESGYGNITGLRMSYKDAMDNRNLSLYPFPDKDYDHFQETEEYSILPNYVSALANDVWYTNSHNKHGQSLFMKNLTGSFRGKFKTSALNFSKIPMPVPEYLSPYVYENPFDRSRNNYEDDEDENSNFANAQNGAEEANSVADGTGFSEDSASDSFYDNGSRYNTLSDNRAYVSQRIGNVSNIEVGDFYIEVTTQRNGEDNLTNSNIFPVIINMQLTDTDQTEVHPISMSGMYFLDNGNIFATTRSAKFESYYALPHLLLNENNFEAVKSYMVEKFQYHESLESSSVHKNLTFDVLREDARETLKCEFVSYLNFNPVNLTKEELEMIDDEILDPIGRPTAEIPKFVINQGLFYSPDCGILFEINNLEGRSHYSQISRIRKVVIGVMILVSLQLYLLIRQMNLTNTPPRISRISYHTLSIMNLIDGTLTMILLISTVIVFDLYISLAIAALITFTLSSIFELRYMVGIYMLQMNEQNVDLWTILRGNPTDDSSNNESSSNNGDVLPTSTGGFQTQAGNLNTNTTTTTNFEDERTVSSNLYSRFFFSLIFCSFLVVNVSTWGRAPRFFTEKLILVFINSYWYPQIVRNVIRGSRTSFSWEFIIGTSIVRLLPIYYVLGYSNNVFHHHTDYNFLIGLTIFKLISIAALYIQEKFGPRVLIPKRYLPNIYNYHPTLSLADLENGFGIDLLNSKHKTVVSSNGDHTHKEIFKMDCAICMTDVDIPVTTKNEGFTDGHDSVAEDDRLLNGTDTKLVVADDFMITPCHHIFHNDCLENWMRYKLKCPVCRNPLPPI